jgi:iron(III) transport system substrate-binding protein
MLIQKKSCIFRRSRQIVSFLTLLTTLLLLLSACASSTVDTTSPGSVTVLSSSPTAMSGATLTLYASLTQPQAQKLAQAFENYASGVTVNIVTADTGTLLTRVQAEQKVGGVKADVILFTDPSSMDILAQQKLLSTYKPAEEPLLPQTFVGNDWAGAFSINDVIIYHKGMTLPVPARWSDLTASIYRNQVEFSTPTSSDQALAFVGYLSQASGWPYFSLLRKNGAVDVASMTQVANDVAAGTVSIGVVSDELARELIDAGAAIKIAWPQDGALAVPAPVSLVTGHESLLAVKFINWLFSNAGQNAVTTLGYTPALSASTIFVATTATPTTMALTTPTTTALTTTATATRPLVAVNINQILSQRTAILQQFRTIFLT